MSNQAETARRWLEALSRADFEEALGLLHPDVELVPPGGQSPVRGTEGLRRWMEPDAFPGQTIDPLELDAGRDGRVLSKQYVKARGARSGIELDVISWCVFTFDEECLITRV